MYNFDMDIEAEKQKLEAKIKKLQEEKAKLAERMETEKQRIDLSRKVGLLVVNEFEGKSFTYDAFKDLLEKHLITNFDRQFFGFQPLAENDPRRPKRRGRKPKDAS